MESSLSVPLRDQENLKEFFRILVENGLREEKEQVLSLADYIDSLDEQFRKVLSELQNVKQQLDQMQKMLYGTMGMLNGMEKQTDQTLKKLDSLGQRAEEIRKPSVKESLRSLQEKKQPDAGRRLPVKKKEALRYSREKGYRKKEAEVRFLLGRQGRERR